MTRRDGLRRVVGGLTLLVAAASGLAACGAGGEAQCATDFEAAATSVPGVASADFKCEQDFEGSYQSGTVVIDAASTEEAYPIVEGVLQAFAAEDALDEAWQPDVDYVSDDGSVTVRASDVGFNSLPSVGEIREHYGIEP